METIHGLNVNGDAIIATGVVFTVLSVIAVGLRFASKRITSSSVKVDDWLLLAALAVYVTAETLVIRFEADVVGRRAVSPEDDEYITYQRYVYIYSIFYFVVIGLAQVSILLFYRQLFLPTHMRYTSLIFVAICGAWLLASLVIEIGYPSYPISKYFPGSSTTKFNVVYLPFWLAMAIIETLIEITILILPIREIIRLQLSRHKKILLSLIFAMGSFVVITSIIRMAVLYRPGEADFDLSKGDIWLNVHLGTAIISACLPTYRPLVSRKTSLTQIFYPSRDSYQIEENESLQYRKKSSATSHSTWLPDSLYTSHPKERQGNFVNARGSGSISLIGLGSQDGAVESGAAIGVKQTVDVV